MGLARYLIIGLALIEPSYAQSVGEKTGVNTVLGITPKTADFVKEIAENNLFVIESSKLAVAKTDRKVKEFAQELLADYTRSTTELKDLADRANVPFPTKMNLSQQRLFQNEDARTGDDFTQLFLDDQVTAHKSGLSLVKRYVNKGENADLRAWANRRQPFLQGHLDRAQNLDKSPND